MDIFCIIWWFEVKEENIKSTVFTNRITGALIRAVLTKTKWVNVGGSGLHIVGNWTLRQILCFLCNYGKIMMSFL